MSLFYIFGAHGVGFINENMFALVLRCRYQHDGVKEFEWRTGVKLRPYIFDAIKLVDVLPMSLFPSGSRPDGLEFVHFPIVDCAIANDSSVLQVWQRLISNQQLVYA